MPNYTAKNVILKDTSGNYLIPYTGCVKTINSIAPDSTGNLALDLGIKNWKSSTEYTANDSTVVYQGLLYKCTSTHTSTETFDSSKWSIIGTNILPYAQGVSYIKDISYCSFGNELYVCSESHTAADFDSTKWTKLLGQGMFVDQFVEATDQPISSISLKVPCSSATSMLVAVGNTLLPVSDYSISGDGNTLTFKTPIEAGIYVELRWFTGVQVVEVDAVTKSLTNLTDSGKLQVSYLSCPSTTKKVEELPVSGQTITSPSCGTYQLTVTTTDAGSLSLLNTTTGVESCVFCAASNARYAINLKVNQGDVIQVTYPSSSEKTLTFVYDNGATTSSTFPTDAAIQNAINDILTGPV